MKERKEIEKIIEGRFERQMKQFSSMDRSNENGSKIKEEK